MGPDFQQASILALIQGVTEFLPISSSAHLQLPSLFLGWSDQGLAFDVAVHVGTLFAVLLYFRLDILALLSACYAQLTGQTLPVKKQQDARLAWLLLLASIPAAIAGLLLYEFVAEFGRNGRLIASTSIIFACLLWWVDNKSRHELEMADWDWRCASLVGVSQVFALIPGTSRSGITMTAALQCGFTRQAAARFSFLLAIPIILGSGGVLLVQLWSNTELTLNWGILIYAAALAAITALLCIHYFLQLISRLGFLPFVVYRVALGLLLFLVV